MRWARAEAGPGSVNGDYFAGGLTAAAMSATAVGIAGSAAGACAVSVAVGIPAKMVRKVGKNTSNTGEAALVVATTGGGPVMKMVEIQMGVVTVVMDVGDILQTVVATGTGLTARSVLIGGTGRCKSELSVNVLSKSGEKSALRNCIKK